MSDQTNPSSKSVLIVEDDRIVAADLQERLQLFGYRVTGVVSSGECALEQMCHRIPDLVLMDIQLEGKIDGIEAAAALYQNFGVRSVFLTAHTEDDLLKRAAFVDPYGYLVKPITDGELWPVLQIAIYRKQIEQDRFKLLQSDHGPMAKMLDGTLTTLAEILGIAAPQALAKGNKLRRYMRTFSEALSIENYRSYELAGLLAEIGQICVPPTIVQKIRGGLNLTGFERDLVTRLPEFGAKLLTRIPGLEQVGEMVMYQKKSFDGSGFPSDSLAGIRIPLGGRMLRILLDIVQLEAANHSRGQIADQLRAVAHDYDPQLLKTAISCLIEAPPPGSKSMKLDELRIGQILAAPIETADGTVLVGSTTSISAQLIEKLMKFSELNSIKEPIYVIAS